MKDQRLEIPTDVRELVERTVYQVEKAFTYFFQAAKVPYPPPGEMAIKLAERNIEERPVLRRTLFQWPLLHQSPPDRLPCGTTSTLRVSCPLQDRRRYRQSDS